VYTSGLEIAIAVYDPVFEGIDARMQDFFGEPQFKINIGKAV
jgi:hypothetical protein